MASGSKKKTKIVACYVTEVEEEDEPIATSMRSCEGMSHSFTAVHHASGNRKSLWAIRKSLLNANEMKARSETSLNNERVKEQSFKDKAATQQNKSERAEGQKSRRMKVNERDEGQVFLKVKDGDKCGTIFHMCSKIDDKPVVVCCLFGRDVDTVSAYLSTRKVLVGKAHRGLHKKRNEEAEQNFAKKKIQVFVTTADLLLRMKVAFKFTLINFEIPVNISDFKRLVLKACNVTTFINEKSPGLSLIQLEQEGFVVPPFVQDIINRCHFGHKEL